MSPRKQKHKSRRSWINKPLGGLIGGVPIKYHIVICYHYSEGTPRIEKPWSVSPDLTVNKIQWKKKTGEIVTTSLRRAGKRMVRTGRSI